MGTKVGVTLYAPSPEKADEAAHAAFAEIAAIDARMSDYKPESELSRLSASAGSGPQKVSLELLEVLTASQHYSELSGGAFDVTVGHLVRLWRRARKERRMPSPEELRTAIVMTGSKNLRLDPAARTAELAKSGMILDLGAIAKGYACDRALAVLARHGLTSAFVDTGGGMALGDPPPGRPGWRIRVADTEQILVLSRCGVSTSGDWDQFVILDGKRYSHIVDPSTGLGLTRRELVTVLAPDGMSADALSTTISVLGPERGLRLAEDLPGVEAWMRWEEAGRPCTATTPGFTRKK